MKTFYIPILNNVYKDEAAVQMEDKPWQEVQEMALKFYDKDYVSTMMDYNGYIEIKTEHGKFRYIQE